MSLEPEVLVRAVDEFYSTQDNDRRQQLNNDLVAFKSSFSVNVTVPSCFYLLNRVHSANVQYFGALSLYETVRQRWEEIVADTVLMEQVKVFLINALTEGAPIQSQSLTNKLSATLALLALYAMPDVWATPVQDLTTIWTVNPELLLRVLAELAAEFPNVHMPLTQRSILKTELHRVSEDMIRVLNTVLSTVMASPSEYPSLLNAAVECVEQWLRLPGSNLRQWTPLLSTVFNAVVDDSAALTNLLTILGANDDLINEDQLVQDVLEYVCNGLSQKLLSELNLDPLSEEVSALSAATCSLAEGVIPVLIRLSTCDSSLLIRLTQFFASLSSLTGRYPMDEGVSEMPHIYLSSLREEIYASREPQRTKLKKAVESTYAAVLEGAVDKLAYAPREVYQGMSSEDKEAFENYRSNRSECSLNSYYIVGAPTLDYLNGQLQEAIASADVNRVESIVFCWEQVADHLSADEYSRICKFLEIAPNLLKGTASTEEDCRLACTLMRLLYDLSHLVSTHDESDRLEHTCVSMILPHLEVLPVTEEALKTVAKLIDDRPSWLMEYGTPMVDRCFALFQDEKRSPKHRLAALRCIGVALSIREPGEIMGMLQNALQPYLEGLGETARDEAAEKKNSFQIGIFSCLFSTLHCKARPGAEALVQLLRSAAPVLQTIIQSNRTPVTADRVCDALRSACSALPTDKLAEFIPVFKNVIAYSLDCHPLAACSLAKSLVICCSSVARNELACTVCEWITHFDNSFPADGSEEWLSLMLQVIRKDWKLVRDHQTEGLTIIIHSLSLSSKALTTSEDPQVAQLAAQLMATIVKEITTRSMDTGRKVLEERGAMIVELAFKRVQVDLLRQTIDALAEVLFYFAQAFTTQTRAVISQQENGNTPMVSAMFREIGNIRNFKQMTLRLNHAARKDCASI